MSTALSSTVSSPTNLHIPDPAKARLLAGEAVLGMTVRGWTTWRRSPRSKAST